MKHVFNLYFDKVFVINLEDSKDRLQTISHLLNQEGVEFERFPAWDKKMCADYIFEKKNRKVSVNSTTGCAFSHYKVLQECIARGYEKVLILEDDAVIANQHYKIYFENAVSNLPYDWAFLKLGYNVSHQMTAKDDFSFEAVSENLFSINAASLTTADAFNIKNIKRNDALMKIFIDDETMFDNTIKPVDHRYYKLCKENGVKQYIVHPMIFSQSDGYSFIEETHRNMINITERTHKIVEELRKNEMVNKLF